MAITKGSLVLVPVALFFLLVLQVEAGSGHLFGDELVANGTVKCSNNAAADLQGVPVEVSVNDIPIRSNVTSSNGKFTIGVPDHVLRVKNLNNPSTDIIKINLKADEELAQKVCPSGTLQLEESYAKVNHAPNLISFGVHTSADGTRTYFREIP